MGSLAYESRSDGSNLTKGDLQSLKDSIKGKVIIKGEVDDAEYKAAVHRWNEAYSKEAVWAISAPHPIQF